MYESPLCAISHGHCVIRVNPPPSSPTDLRVAPTFMRDHHFCDDDMVAVVKSQQIFERPLCTYYVWGLCKALVKEGKFLFCLFYPKNNCCMVVTSKILYLLPRDFLYFLGNTAKLWETGSIVLFVQYLAQWGLDLWQMACLHCLCTTTWKPTSSCWLSACHC